MNTFKTLSVILITVSMFSLLGCSSFDQKQADETVDLLEEKYKQEFVATHIGERYGTVGNDTVTTFNHPNGQKNVVFKAVMNKNGELVGDNYIPVLISKQFNDILEKELNSLGIESESFTVAMGANSSRETDTTITIVDYLEKYNPAYFSAQMIVKDTGNVTGEQFEKALTKAYEAGLETVIQIQARFIPEEEFEKAEKDFVKLPEITSSWFLDYNVTEKLDVVVDGNGYNFRYSGGHSATGEGGL